MKISHYILLSFFIILILFSLTTYINFKQSEAVRDNAAYVDKSGQVVRAANRFQRNILNMVSGLRGYLLTGEKYFIESYDSAANENEVLLREVSSLIPDTSIQKRRLGEIRKLNEQWTDEFAEPLRKAKMLSIVNDSNLDYFKTIYRQKVNTGTEKDLHKRLQEKFRVFTNYEYEYRDVRRKTLDRLVQQTKRVSFILTLSSILISILIVCFLAFRISNRIRSMVRLADEISSGNYKVHIDDPGKDELSKLSSSLNNMAGALSENISLLKRKNQELDQFAHIVSHDLKGPLRGIDNVITWIDEDYRAELPLKVNEYLDMIKGRVIRAENLIEGILSYARIDKEVIHQEDIPVTELVKEIVENSGSDPRLNIMIEERMPVLYTERLPLFQVLSNLISNAVKYHDKPGGNISIFHKNHSAHYEFFVADDGPGIAPHHHDRIFVIFQTLQDRDSFESTGVGLAIVRKILDTRGETIRIESGPGQGSVFSFTWKK